MYEDQTIKCVDCGNDFVFTTRDQEFFEQQRFSPPKRCKPCRTIKKKRKLEEEAYRKPVEKEPYKQPVSEEEDEESHGGKEI